MTLYTSDGASYEGMSEDVITALRTDLGCSTAFITKEEYDVIIAALQA